MLNLSSIRGWKSLKNSLSGSTRCFAKDSGKIAKADKTQSLFEVSKLNSLGVNIWNEKAAIKRAKKNNRTYRKINSQVELLRVLQNLKSFPVTLTNWLHYFKRKLERTNIIEQTYLPQRVSILKRDLAAAHFMIYRSGAVKFVGQSEWVGGKGSTKILPVVYVPGLYIEAINAEGTNLYFEGLQNISGLTNLKWLSLKKLNEVNDWFLDWISKEYYETLEYLDISECKGVTYRGLSCFYRFQHLKTLIVKGIPDTPEFKVACIMLQDVIPELDIQGIELSIPKTINPVFVEEVKDKNLP